MDQKEQSVANLQMVESSAMPSKLEQLDALHREWENKFPEYFRGQFVPEFVPEKFDFMFIAEMPSNPLMAQGKRNFGITKRDRLLATVMKNNGVEGSYVTDIVKIKQQARMPDNNEVETFRPCLLKEIEIIQPRIIIVLGRRTYENSFKPYLEEEVSKSGIKIAWVFHYSSQVKTKKFVDKFNEVVGGMNFR